MFIILFRFLPYSTALRIPLPAVHTYTRHTFKQVLKCHFDHFQHLSKYLQTFAAMAFYPPICDSFFEESYDDADRIQRARAFGQLKVLNRERQIALAEGLSELAKAEYQEDFLSHMEQMEVRRCGFPICLPLANQCIVCYSTRRRLY